MKKTPASSSEPFRWVVAGRKDDVGTQVFFGERPQHLRGPAFGDRRPTVDHEIGLQTSWVLAAGQHRQRDAVISTNVVNLPTLGLVSNHNLVTFDANPNQAHLGPPIGLDRYEVNQRGRLQDLSYVLSHQKLLPALLSSRQD